MQLIIVVDAMLEKVLAVVMVGSNKNSESHLAEHCSVITNG